MTDTDCITIGIEFFIEMEEPELLMVQREHADFNVASIEPGQKAGSDVLESTLFDEDTDEYEPYMPPSPPSSPLMEPLTIPTEKLPTQEEQPQTDTVQEAAKRTRQELGRQLADYMREQRAKGRKFPSKSKRAGTILPIGRVIKYLKRTNDSKRISDKSGIYLTAVLEYLVSEVLDLGGLKCREYKHHRISPRHIQLAVNEDQELKQLFDQVIIPHAGVTPFIHPELYQSRRTRLRTYRKDRLSNSAYEDEDEDQQQEEEPELEEIEQEARRRREELEGLDVPPLPGSPTPMPSDEELNEPAPEEGTAERGYEPSRKRQEPPARKDQSKRGYSSESEESSNDQYEQGDRGDDGDDRRRDNRKRMRKDTDTEEEADRAGEEDTETESEQEDYSEFDDPEKQKRDQQMSAMQRARKVGKEEEEESDTTEEEEDEEDKEWKEGEEEEEEGKEVKGEEEEAQAPPSRRRSSRQHVKLEEEEFSGDRSGESDITQKLDNYKRQVIARYYHYIGQKGGKSGSESEAEPGYDKRVKPKHTMDMFSPHERKIIHNYLSNVGRRGGSHSHTGDYQRAGRKLTGKEYNKRDLRVERLEEQRASKRQKLAPEVETEKPKTSRGRAPKEPKRVPSKQPVAETPRKKVPAPRRRGPQKQKGDVEITKAFEQMPKKGRPTSAQSTPAKKRGRKPKQKESPPANLPPSSTVSPLQMCVPTQEQQKQLEKALSMEKKSPKKSTDEKETSGKQLQQMTPQKKKLTVEP